MAVSIAISITQNSQNIAENTSNVTVKVTASWTYGSYNHYEQPGYLTIGGTKYTFTSPFNTGETDSGSQTLFTKTVNIGHNSDGTKTLSCSASYTSGVSSGTVTATASKTLTTIARASTATASNGTLGSAHTITINRKNDTFKHKIYYVFGGETHYIAGGASSFTTATSATWTPPLNLASKNTTGESMTCWFTLETYTSGGSLIGTISQKVTMAIPASIKPSPKITVSDVTTYTSTFGNYVKGKSKLNVSVSNTAELYGATISSYITSVNGATYTGSSLTTSELKTAGTLTISTTITDSRGRTATSSSTITVLDYSAPKISTLSVIRCDSTGAENAQGDHIKVTFNASITNLNNKNAVSSCVFSRKKSSETAYTDTSVTWGSGVYTLTNQQIIFEAATDSSYDIKLTITDGLETTTRTTSASTAEVIMHFNSAGNGIGLGKISELEDAVELGWSLYDKFGQVVGNGLASYTGSGTSAIDPNTTLEHIILTNHTNAPTSGTFFYIHTVFDSGKSTSAYRAQYAFPYNTNGSMYHRYYNGSWSSWRRHINEDEIFSSQTNNYVLAAPSDAAGEPSFRKLVASDIPNLSASKIKSGTLGIARGGTGTANLKILYGTATMKFYSGTSSSCSVSFGHTYKNKPSVVTSQVFDSHNIIVKTSNITTTEFTATVPAIGSNGSREFSWIAIGV